MTKRKTMFFDNDCISAFLWVDNTDIITELYGDNIFVPTEVYNELIACQGPALKLKTQIEQMINNKKAFRVDMNVNSDEYSLFTELAIDPPNGERIIGKGEAACIALAKEQHGLIASNNLKDISKYIERYSLAHTTTADILVEAFDKGIVSKAETEQLWAEMLSKRRRLGANSFEEYLRMIGK
ncbi:MAG: hypothetical protein K6B69_16015 [Lachnospiraceae bacterium]|nr:hypothetical protein [Lachnospiraceae bacterium]